MVEKLEEIKNTLGNTMYNLLVDEAKMACLGRKVETDHDVFVREYIEKNYRKFIPVNKGSEINAA